MFGWIFGLVMSVLVVVIQSIRKPNRRRPRFDPYTQQGLQDDDSEDLLTRIKHTEEYYDLNNKSYDVDLNHRQDENK